MREICMSGSTRGQQVTIGSPAVLPYRPAMRFSHSGNEVECARASPASQSDWSDSTFMSRTQALPAGSAY